LHDFTASANAGFPYRIFTPVFNLKIDMVDFAGSAAEAFVERLENLDISQVL
jgi:hypothetical protein